MPEAVKANELSARSHDAAGLDQLSAGAVRSLKARDNRTNWRHIGGVWLIIAATMAATVAAEGYLVRSGQSLWWLVPVLVLSTVIIGASQHQLGGVIHEGTHFLLFENKQLNELASDWLAAFALYTTTYQFRVHHLAHHQFVNDPERDPDISQLIDSHHWLDFPVTHIDVTRKLLRQLWPLNLARFTLVRARYSAVGHDRNPYVQAERKAGKLPVYVGIGFAVVAPIIASNILRWHLHGVAFAILAMSYAGTMLYFLLLDSAKFPQTRLQPVISHRATVIGRMTFLFVFYTAFTLYDWSHGGQWAWDHFGVLWVLPLFTTFPLFLMIRQWVQHGNADRGRYTNTRVFLMGPLVRYAIFPWGMDYHLPHHMMASVPHYNLKALHQLLLNDPQYAEKGVVVEGHLGSDDGANTGHPTLISVLGHTRAPKTAEAVHVDNATLEYAEVADSAAIAQQARLSSGG